MFQYEYKTAFLSNTAVHNLNSEDRSPSTHTVHCQFSEIVYIFFNDIMIIYFFLDCDWFGIPTAVRWQLKAFVDSAVTFDIIININYTFKKLSNLSIDILISQTCFEQLLFSRHFPRPRRYKNIFFLISFGFKGLTFK